MVTSAPFVTVTIAQWGKVDFTERCVRALLRSRYEGELEILVYDNASPGGPGPAADFDEVEVVRGDTNIGFGPAHDHLAEIGRGDLLLILNNDTILTRYAIQYMVEAISKPGVGVVTPRYLGFDGNTLEMGGFVGQDGWAVQLFRGVQPPQYMTRVRFPADYGSAACLLTPRSLFLESGGFDDTFAPAYYEDTDYCFRLSENDYRVVVEPKAIVYHFEGATAGKDISTGMKRLQEDHRALFAQRWNDRLEVRPQASVDSAMVTALGLEGHAVLWVAPELPRPDHEAGHARMVSMLRVLREHGSAPVLWAEMAPEWERYAAMFEGLDVPWFGYRVSGRLNGVSTAEYSTIQELLTLRAWDAVVISFPEMAERFLPLIREFAPEVPVLIDAVDLHFLRADRDPSTSSVQVEFDKEAELLVYRSSDGVITAGHHELELLVDLLPEVPASAFSSVATLALSDEPLSSADGQPVFLGNLNHLPNLAAVDHWVGNIFPRLPEEARRPLVLYGSGSERFAERWPDEAVDVRGWASDLADVFSQARCFVAPLTFGAGTKGKILEAAAAGVPVVTTSIGAEGYEGALLDSITVTDEPASFGHRVGVLLSDEEAWRTAREAVLTGAIDWERRAIIEQSEWALWVQRRRRLT